MLDQQLLESYFGSTSESVRTASNDRLMSFSQSLDSRQTIVRRHPEGQGKGSNKKPPKKYFPGGSACSFIKLVANITIIFQTVKYQFVSFFTQD